MVGVVGMLHDVLEVKAQEGVHCTLEARGFKGVRSRDWDLEVSLRDKRLGA